MINCLCIIFSGFLLYFQYYNGVFSYFLCNVSVFLLFLLYLRGFFCYFSRTFCYIRSILVGFSVILENLRWVSLLYNMILFIVKKCLKECYVYCKYQYADVLIWLCLCEQYVSLYECVYAFTHRHVHWMNIYVQDPWPT